MEDEDIVLGYVSELTADYWEIPEQKFKPIVQGKDWLNTHGQKHKCEFKSEYSFNQTVESLQDIIQHPSYVFYNQKENGLEFYKKVIEDVTVVVRITGKKKLYLATIYPSSSTKLKNRKIKEIELDNELMEKYLYKEKK